MKGSYSVKRLKKHYYWCNTIFKSIVSIFVRIALFPLISHFLSVPILYCLDVPFYTTTEHSKHSKLAKARRFRTYQNGDSQPGMHVEVTYQFQINFM